mmetsp:Transcript_9158/g.19903  ORF Transcript_9158/g.19903 Transcript_9158/m.19903 type:complete len:97 (-) Transcript_9158:218-508(-)
MRIALCHRTVLVEPKQVIDFSNNKKRLQGVVTRSEIGAIIIEREWLVRSRGDEAQGSRRAHPRTRAPPPTPPPMNLLHANLCVLVPPPHQTHSPAG